MTALDSVWDYVAKAFESTDAHLRDPVGWAQEKLGEHLWSKQRDILESVRDNRYTAVQSCHDAGKSFVAARAVAWWIDSHPPGEAFVVSTAPTGAQVSAILWREVGKAKRRGDLPGRVLASGYPQWKLDDGELVGYGRKPADHSESAFQGIHARYVLIVVDEACGIERGLFDAVDALATNESARVLAIGNPDDPSSHFAAVCKPTSGWNVIRIDGLRTPNFTESEVAKYPALRELMAAEQIEPSTEPIPESVRPMLLSPLWVAERIERWGTSSALFTAKVRGEFPDTSNEGVIPLGWVQRAVERWRDWDDKGRPELPGRRIVGVDVAREGDDRTVFAVRRGPAIERIDPHVGLDTMQTTNLVSALLNAPHALGVVDVIGVGAGVVDRLRELEYPTVAFNAAAKTDRTDRTGEFGFTNSRAAAWWRLRELLDPANSKHGGLMLPDEEQLVADLTAPRWRLRQQGKIQIEAKDEIKKRLGRSTDVGDAVVQAYWVDGAPVHGASVVGSGAVQWFNDVDDDTALAWASPSGGEWEDPW